MMWSAWIVVLLVVAVSAIAFAGSRLPMKHVASSRARYGAEPRLVFDAARSAIDASDQKVDVVESDPPRRIVTRIPPGGPFGGTWTCEIAPVDGGTTLTIIEHGEVYNPMFRFLSRFVFGHYGTQERFLRAVATRLHETTVSERLPAG